MKQFVQNYKNGELKLIETPAPLLKPGGMLVKNVNSVISLGTEKLIVEFGGKSLLGKALARPDLTRKAVELVKMGGIREAYRQAMNRLDTYAPIGYSSAGVVLEVGEGVNEFKVGDRVTCAKSGYASHAEIIFVPKNLCVQIPDNVDFESAAFGPLGAIPLHAIRLCELNLGENVAIIGLGLLGQLAVQLAKAAGYKVLGMDINSEKVSLTRRLGADSGIVIGRGDEIGRAMKFSKGYGFDAVLIFASGSTNQPLEIASEICREKGKIVVPGMVKLDVPRQTFYQKELSLIVSKAWGPGFGDADYELRGKDYPYAYVRWTEGRNIEQFLELVKDEKVKLEPLVTHRFRIEEAETAYKAIMGDNTGKYIGIILCYETQQEKRLTTKIQLKKEVKKAKLDINVGLIGAGNFAKTNIMPIIKGLPFVNLRAVATATGASGRHAGDKFGFEYCTTDYEEVLKDPEIDCVLIATRPNLHAKLVIEALKYGKDVFVEKPLALSRQELKEIIRTLKKNQQRLMVGINRRFASLSIKAKELLSDVTEPLVLRYLINASPFPKDRYILDPIEGGGIVKADWCHLIDLAQYISGSLPAKLYAEALSSSGTYAPNENLVVTLTFANGSIASLIWVANGGNAFTSERVEIFGGGVSCIIDKFRSLVSTKGGKKKRIWKFDRDMGHENQFRAFFSSIQKGDKSPVDFNEYVYITLATFLIEECLSKGIPIEIDPRRELGDLL